MTAAATATTNHKVRLLTARADGCPSGAVLMLTDHEYQCYSRDGSLEEVPDDERLTWPPSHRGLYWPPEGRENWHPEPPVWLAVQNRANVQTATTTNQRAPAGDQVQSDKANGPGRTTPNPSKGKRAHRPTKR